MYAHVLKTCLVYNCLDVSRAQHVDQIARQYLETEGCRGQDLAAVIAGIGEVGVADAWVVSELLTRFFKAGRAPRRPGDVAMVAKALKKLASS